MHPRFRQLHWTARSPRPRECVSRTRSGYFARIAWKKRRRERDSSGRHTLAGGVLALILLFDDGLQEFIHVNRSTIPMGVRSEVLAGVSIWR